MSCFPCKPLLTHQTRRVNYAVAGFSFKKGLRREADFAFAPGSHQTMGPSINYVTMTNYSSPPQLRYPQLSYFRSNAILNWVPKNSS